jgi:hypothetical protein
MMRPAVPGDAPKPPALPPEIAGFLSDFAIALQRHAMYPGAHPSLAPAVNNVARRTAQLFERRDMLALGVARDQLIVEGVPTDPKHPMLSDLARWLHRHHLGAVALYRGIDADEIADLLRALGVDPDRAQQPLGFGPRERLRSWPHARLLPIDYDRLSLVDEAAAELDPSPVSDDESAQGDTRRRIAELWNDLARAAHGGEAANDAALDPASVARAIAAHAPSAEYDRDIGGRLQLIVDELQDVAGEDVAALRARTGALVRGLDRGTLRRVLEMGGDASRRRRLVRAAAEGLPVDAVVHILDAAAKASKQEISHSLVRLLSKLAIHATRGAAAASAAADASLREQVRQLLSNWELDDPNPESYARSLQAIARASAPVSLADVVQHPVEDERLVQMGLELDADGAMARRAAERWLARGQLAQVLNLLAHAPVGTTGQARRAIEALAGTPDQIAQVLLAEPLDEVLLDRVLAIAGPAAAEPLLDALARAESRSLRRLLIDHLRKLGPTIGPAVVARLHDDRWYVLRNLLTLLEDFPEVPAGFSPAQLADHPDARVRRHVLKLQLKHPVGREKAIAAALADPDPQLGQLALLAVPEDISPALAQRIEQMIGDKNAPADLRVLAIRALSHSRAPTTLAAILTVVDGGKSLLGRLRLARKSPEMLAALSVLAARWMNDPRAAAFVAIAAQSRDPDIVAAAAPPRVR